MNFFNTTGQINNNKNNMILSHQRYSFFNNKNIISNSKPINITEKPVETNKMKWGEPTWYLFHTLAQKVKTENFSQIRLELIRNIVSICNNLPCPTCAKHATEYMNNVNFSTIKTKQDLIDLLFNFHNVVNAKKNYPLFPYSEVEDKYSKAITANIIKHFMFFFQDKQYNVSMISNNLHRARIINTLKDWFNENIKYFDL